MPAPAERFTWLVRCCGGLLADDPDLGWWSISHKPDCPDPWQVWTTNAQSPERRAPRQPELTSGLVVDDQEPEPGETEPDELLPAAAVICEKCETGYATTGTTAMPRARAAAELSARAVPAAWPVARATAAAEA
jgi:hypothetical protein